MLLVVQTLRCLANGFLISGMLWAAALAMILDGRMRAAAGYFLVAGLCAWWGSSIRRCPASGSTCPGKCWREVPKEFATAVQYQTPYHWAAAYGLVALLLVGLSYRREEKDPMEPPPIPAGL